MFHADKFNQLQKELKRVDLIRKLGVQLQEQNITHTLSIADLLELPDFVLATTSVIVLAI